MSIFARRLDAAIRASGKTGEEIARAAQVHRDTVSRLRTGEEDNPTLQVILRVAHEAGTTVGALLGESIEISEEDERELLRFRNWIDEKLATVDASREPNAELLPEEKPAATPRAKRVADRHTQLVLRAIGDSMRGAGILDGDTLYATAHGDAASAVGAIVACRIGDGVFVKRLVSEHRQLYLRSAHPRYKPIAVDPKTFELLGRVTERTGAIG